MAVLIKIAEHTYMCLSPGTYNTCFAYRVELILMKSTSLFHVHTCVNIMFVHVCNVKRINNLINFNNTLITHFSNHNNSNKCSLNGMKSVSTCSIPKKGHQKSSLCDFN